MAPESIKPIVDSSSTIKINAFRLQKQKKNSKKLDLTFLSKYESRISSVNNDNLINVDLDLSDDSVSLNNEPDSVV